MLRRHQIAKPPAYRRRQDLGTNGTGVRRIIPQNTEFYSIEDVYAGTKKKKKKKMKKK